MKNRKNTNKVIYLGVLLTAFISLNSKAFAQGPPQGKQQGPPNFSELLSKMDTDKDGKLSKEEIDGPLKKDFTKVDTNSDGFITKEEFDKAPKPKGKKGPNRKK